MSQFLLFGEWDIYRFLYKHLPFVMEITGQIEVFTTKMLYAMCHLLPSNLLKIIKKKKTPNPQMFSSIEDAQKPIASSRVFTPKKSARVQQFSKLLQL